MLDNGPGPFFSQDAFDYRMFSLAKSPLRATPLRRTGTLCLVTLLGIYGGLKPRVAAAAANGGQAQTGQTYAGRYFGYPPNPHKTEYSTEEEKAIGRVESAFGKYGSACIQLFKPELIGLAGGTQAPVEIAEMLRLKGAETLLDANSLAGAISEASVLMSQPDSELTEWQRRIKRELKMPLPDYWNMPASQLTEAAKEAEKNYVQDEMKAGSHPGDKDAPAHLLYAFLFARQLYGIRLAELWQRPETQKDPRILDYVRSLLRDGEAANIAHMPKEIPDGGMSVSFVLFTPSGDAVMELDALDTPTTSKSGKKNQRRQRSSAVRLEVVIVTRKGNEFNFVRYYVFKRVPDGYTPADGPPLADLAFAHYRWVMPPSSHDQVTWSATRAFIKKDDSFPFQNEMVLRLAPENPYLAGNYLYGGAFGPVLPGESHLALSELREQSAAKESPARDRMPTVVAVKADAAAVSAPAAVPVPVAGINPIFTTESLFAIPGTNPIGKGLIDNATENVNQAMRWLNPLIRDAKDDWAELVNGQPREAATGVIGVHFSVSPSPPFTKTPAQLIMSKSTTSLSIGLPAEHYQDPGAIFADLLELLIWNLPPQPDRARHDELVRQIKKSAAAFHYPGGPLPPDVLAKLGVGASFQAKSLVADTPDTGNSTGIYDGDIQGRVIGSTVKCFNFLFSNGIPYLIRVQNLALQKAKEPSEATDAESKYWQALALTLGEDVRAIQGLLESLPGRLKVDFYIRPAESITMRGGQPKPPKIPESEPGVRLTIALDREEYERGPATVKDALVQQLGGQLGGIAVRRAIDDFFLLFAQDPANQSDYFAVTMRQLNPQPDGTLGTFSKLWPPQTIK